MTENKLNKPSPIKVAIKVFSKVALVLLSYVGAGGILSARAADVGAGLPDVGASVPWQLWLQDAYSPLARDIAFFHDNVLSVIALVISVVVALLLLFVCVKFSARRNKKPSKTSHVTWLEIVWTTVPALTLLIIFVPSLKLLKSFDLAVDADMTIKVTGRQWYWTYDYPDYDDISLDSFMIPEAEAIATGKRRLMDTDQPLVVPVGKRIRLLITASDVLHAWAVPSLGVRMDAVPGRNNEAWTMIEKPGIYYGFCSELCGKDHSYMPIHIVAVEEKVFTAWVKDQVALLALNKKNDTRGLQLAFAAERLGKNDLSVKTTYKSN